MAKERSRLMERQGYVIAASVNLRMLHKLGFGTVSGWCSVSLALRLNILKTLVLGAVLQTVAYAVQASAPPFPVFAAVYLLAGFGVSLQVRDTYSSSNSFSIQSIGTSLF